MVRETPPLDGLVVLLEGLERLVEGPEAPGGLGGEVAAAAPHDDALYVCIYIYIYRERESFIYIYIYIHTHTFRQKSDHQGFEAHRRCGFWKSIG